MAKVQRKEKRQKLRRKPLQTLQLLLNYDDDDDEEEEEEEEDDDVPHIHTPTQIHRHVS
jgi:hypothetical protein